MIRGFFFGVVVDHVRSVWCGMVHDYDEPTPSYIPIPPRELRPRCPHDHKDACCGRQVMQYDMEVVHRLACECRIPW